MKDLKLLKEYTILYVEDNIDISEEIAFFLERKVKKLYIANNGKEGLEKFDLNKPDVVITDIQMPVMNGLDMIDNIRQKDISVPIMITTAFNDENYLLKAINLKVDAYITKPLNMRDMIYSLFKIIEPLELKKELETKTAQLELQNIELEKLKTSKPKR